MHRARWKTCARRLDVSLPRELFRLMLVPKIYCAEHDGEHIMRNISSDSEGEEQRHKKRKRKTWENVLEQSPPAKPT